MSALLTQVISTSGDTHLGGEDFDHRVMDYFIKLIKRKYKEDISKDNRALQKLRREVERAKRALSSAHQVRLCLASKTTFEALPGRTLVLLPSVSVECGHARRSLQLVVGEGMPWCTECGVFLHLTGPCGDRVSGTRRGPLGASHPRPV